MKFVAVSSHHMIRTFLFTVLALSLSIGVGLTSPAKAAVNASGLPDIVGVVKQVMPAVVNISTTRVVQTEGRSPFPFLAILLICGPLVIPRMGKNQKNIAKVPWVPALL